MKIFNKKTGLFLAAVLGTTSLAAGPVMAADSGSSAHAYQKDYTVSSAQTCQKAYTAFARKQQKKSKEKLFMKVIKSGQPILLLTDKSSVFTDMGVNAVSARIYQYRKGKVTYVSSLRSTGTAYPLCRKGAWLLSGYHHASARMRVSGGTATIERLTGLYMDKSSCHYKKWTVKNGKLGKELKSEKIPAKKAEAMDFYITGTGDYAGRPIAFKRVK